VIRLTIPSIEADDLQAVQEVLQTGFLVQGQHVAAFEQAAADYVGAPHAVAVSNCTAALHLSLLALDIQPGDRVLVTAYSWPATANVIALCGAQPVFVDIDPATFNLDLECLETTLRAEMSHRETAAEVKAILPVHAFGQVADMPSILALAERYNLPVIEDAACSFGATLDGRQAGTWGTLGCFSFHPRKAITTGEGGLIVTGDPALARRLRALRNHGLDPDAPTMDFIMPGYNTRMTEFQAALGVTQLGKLDRILAARRRLARAYDALLADTPLQAPVVAPAGGDPVYQSYVVLLPEEAAPRRDAILAELRRAGIEATIGTYHLPLTTYFRTTYGYQPGDFPATDAVFARSITLPLHEALTAEEQATVVRQLVAILEGRA
jgi:perosamine synthetase